MSRPRSRQLLAFGRWARLVMEYSLFVFGALWLLNVVVPQFQDSAWERGPVERVGGIVALMCIPVALVAGLVWFVAEVIAGYREPRK